MLAPGVPFDPARVTHGKNAPVAGVLHRTYGRWPGDYSVGKNNPNGVGFHFLIGKEAGRWVQFADTTRRCGHAKGGNTGTVGIEFEGTNGDPLTPWQVSAGAWIIAGVSRFHAIDLDYYDGRRVKPRSGWMPHASVAGSDHTDRVTRGDWDRMAALWSAGAPAQVDWAAVRRLAAGKLLADDFGLLPPMVEGTRSLAVVMLQQALNVVTGAGLPETGTYDQATSTALSAFQRFVGIPAGVFDDLTRWWLAVSLTNIRDGRA